MKVDLKDMLSSELTGHAEWTTEYNSFDCKYHLKGKAKPIYAYKHYQYKPLSNSRESACISPSFKPLLFLQEYLFICYLLSHIRQALLIYIC